MSSFYNISIIIPVLNEGNNIQQTLLNLQLVRKQDVELIVVDGGSDDNTVELAKPLCDFVIQSSPGRAKQMNAGANLANGAVLLFLHADTQLPSFFHKNLLGEMKMQNKKWGRFDIKLSSNKLVFRVIESMVNIRSKLSGIATGDQAIFIEKELFAHVKGFPQIDLMEDVAISTTLKKIEFPLCLKLKVITSSRRWEQYGIWKTIILMWKLRYAYFRGEDPNRLARKYL